MMANRARLNTKGSYLAADGVPTSHPDACRHCGAQQLELPVSRVVCPGGPDGVFDGQKRGHGQEEGRLVEALGYTEREKIICSHYN